MSHKCLLCEFKSLATQKLNDEELEVLSANCITVKFAKGTNIIKQGTYSTNIAFLKRGIVKIHITGPYHEQIVRILKAPVYLGLQNTFGDKVNQYSVSAIGETEVCFIDTATFKDLIHNNNGFNDQIIIELCKSELNSYNGCVNRTQKQIRGKIADVLLNFSDRVYVSNLFSLPITQEEIGNLVDSSRESVSRVLTEFVKDGIIEMSGRKIAIINRKLLERISENG
jgi:CRP/FNR family transcriptional regulator